MTDRLSAERRREIDGVLQLHWPASPLSLRDMLTDLLTALDSQTAEVERLGVELAEAKADSERLDHMERTGGRRFCRYTWSDGHQRWACMQMERTNYPQRTEGSETLREAIDDDKDTPDA